MMHKTFLFFFVLLMSFRATAQSHIDYSNRLFEVFKQGDYKSYIRLFDKTKSKDDVLGPSAYTSHWVYLAESYVACGDFEKAVYALTYKHVILNRRMWINGKWWTLNGDDLRKWSIEKKPLMDYLFDKIITYYGHDYELFKKSPLIKHIASLNREGYSIDDLSAWAADLFYSSGKWGKKFGTIYAANFGKIEAQKELAHKYMKGIDVDSDTIKALHYLTMAADQGDVDAANFVANSYLNGVGIAKDYNKAFSLFTKTAQTNDRTAKYGLGLCHYYGYGTPINKTKAIDYLIDVEDWFLEVPYIIGIIYYEQNSKEAITYFNKALNRHSLENKMRGDILRKLSACYRFGRCGIKEIDILKADSLFNEAAKYGEEKAIDVLERFNAINQSFDRKD